MTRRLALTASLLLAGAVPALAQSHTPPHNPLPHPTHGPGHVRPDLATHAALHALLLGSWRGAFSSPRGASSELTLSVAYDSSRNVSAAVNADQTLRAGAASNFVIHGETLEWTQELAGAPCRASAVVSAATPLAPAMMQGKMTCEHDELTFTLSKTAG